MIENKPNDNKPKTLYTPQTVVISDKRELYRSYMPFIKGGGLFIPFNEEITPAKIAPGQKILVVFSMLGSKDKVPISSGIVVWINRGGTHKGFGVRLGDDASMKSLRENIENNIAEFMVKKEFTYTL